MLQKNRRSFTGVARKDKLTKNLVKRLKENEIAIISHKDVDRVSAENLILCKPSVVINTQPMISGKYPTAGPSLLADNGIHLIDLADEKIFDVVREGSEISVVGGAIYHDSECLSEGRELTKQIIDKELIKANKLLSEELKNFASNTLEFIQKEKEHVFNELNVPKSTIDMTGRHVLIAVRGHDYKEDMKALRSYIREVKPVIIAVDGAADLIIDERLKPDVIVGDMDSVSDKALKKASEVILHAYPDGQAPGKSRLDELGIKYEIFPARATSEDLAMLFAYEHGAELITAVGTHVSMTDFLEKDRKGMASTFLTRLKIGGRLVDARGVNKLYRGTVKTSYLISLIMAAVATFIIIIMVSTQFRQIIQLTMMKISLYLGI